MIRCALYPTLLAAALLLSAAGCSTPAAEDDSIAANGDAGGPVAAPPAGPPPAGDPEPTAGSEPRMCTQIGCNDGLSVEVDGFSEEVEIELTADGETRSLTCVPPGPCHHFVPDFMPEEVTVTAFLPDREVERDFTPEYREEQPNGPDCPPVCRQARVRLKL